MITSPYLCYISYVYPYPRAGTSRASPLAYLESTTFLWLLIGYEWVANQSRGDCIWLKQWLKEDNVASGPYILAEPLLGVTLN